MARTAMRGALTLAHRYLRKIKLEDLKSYAKYFSEASFQDKLKSVGTLLGENILLPVLQAYYVLRSPNTPTKSKIFIMGALGYFILPLDFIPDFLPGLFGFTDDLMVISIILKSVSDALTPDITEKALRVYNQLTSYTTKCTKQDSL